MLDKPTDPPHHPAPNRAQHQPLYTEKVLSDRKMFFIDLKENDRGRFVKITEDVRGRRNTIMLPAEALDDFLEALNKVADFEEELDPHPAELQERSESAGDSD